LRDVSFDEKRPLLVRASVRSEVDQYVWLNIPSGFHRRLETHEVFFAACVLVVITSSREELLVLQRTPGLAVVIL